MSLLCCRSSDPDSNICILRNAVPATYKPGLFAVTPDYAATLPVICELDDTDGDGYYDYEDLCPLKGSRSDTAKLWRGCSRLDVDPDGDGVCNMELQEDCPFCDGFDNCPNTKNPLQTISTDSELGDACNLGELLLSSCSVFAALMQ